MISVGQITLFTLIPAAASLIGGLVGSCFQPKERLLSALQHFVAGIVIGAVCTDLLPKVLGSHSHLTVSIGFVIGVAFMLLSEKLIHSRGVVTGACIDLLIDGLLIGIAFLAGMKSGALIAISLSFCAFFLSLAVISTTKSKKPLLLLASMLPIGGFVGGAVVSKLPPIILLETITFGVAALLYLGVEELLGEAHKREDTAWISATFFLGFFLVFIFN